ncbi:sulfotransferase [Jannaschia sp. S6380]|uniref:tetratricopeptide repeat-containing sulfotransferase family protein n=1 Tax=Jannaschia sp. S6380 TaxID=2926408 RepID=UPI001FF2A2A3|nr:tetratricopeptide repeat-containing sulfotransferase family protein [Jannaschia sp. S6380]MCK0167576.1 sulfotransferase [Jannaschia sp. S6380]
MDEEPAQSDSDPTECLHRAQAALLADRADEASALLGPLLERHPGLAEGWLLSARAEAAAGRPDAARRDFATCLRLAPREPVAWLELALFEAGQGRGGTVVKRARKAGLGQALVTMLQGAASGQGAQATGLGAAAKADLVALTRAAKARDLAAVERQAAIILRRKAGARIWAVLGHARLKAGRSRAAAEAFAQGVRLEPYAVDLRLGQAAAAASSGDVVRALVAARRAAELAPLSTRAQVNWGRIALQAGLAERAADIVAQVLAKAPRSDAARVLAAEAAMQTGDVAAALDHARARAEDAPGRDLLVAQTLQRGGQLDAAREVLDRLAARSPGDADVLTARGQLRQTLGETEAAEADLRAAVAARPRGGTAFRALCYGTRLDPTDPVVARMVALRDGGTLPEQAARAIDYGLARVLQAADPEAAARHLAQANASMARSYPYDPAQARQAWTAMTTQVWPALRAALQDGVAGSCDAAPIFVTGLPRSGTTLVEAILGAHPGVTAGGELAVLRRITAPLCETWKAGDPVTRAQLSAAGAAYAERALPDEDTRRTDKSIYSFLEIGVIRAILPKAHVVVVTRDPRDVGLSIWRNHFREGTHRYAATQEGIADQIGQFHQALAFWRAEVPGAFHRIAYEDLLDDPEGRARSLLAACDLDWDPAVLSFHESAKRVATLSFAQVRQPLYRSSKGGWRRSAGEIAPLIRALSERGLLPD